MGQTLLASILLILVHPVSALRIRLSNFGQKEGTQRLISQGSISPLGSTASSGNGGYGRGLLSESKQKKKEGEGGWMTHVVKATAVPSTWSGPNKIHSDPKWCITPPPFGEQRTLYKKDAVFACSQMQGCNALTCADPAPECRADEEEEGASAAPETTTYYKMDPICQPRTTSIEDENDRGLCIQNGGTCEAIKLENVSMQEATARHTLYLDPKVIPTLQVLEELEEGDIVLDYKPGEVWYEGAMSRAQEQGGWQHVKFRTPNDQVKISGKEFVVLRLADSAKQKNTAAAWI
jgi:hypothetical protein